MAYRLVETHVVVGDDSNLADKAFDRSCVLTQTQDLEVAPMTIRVGPSDAEAVITLGTLTTAYGFAFYSDYPVMLRFNGSGGTQFTLTSSIPPVTNVGAPLPAKCCFVCTAQVTSLRVAPISGAAQTATCWLVATGDPTSSYV